MDFQEKKKIGNGKLKWPENNPPNHLQVVYGSTTVVMEVKLHCFHSCGSTYHSSGSKIFLPCLNEFGKSKLLKVYLIFDHGTTMAS